MSRVTAADDFPSRVTANLAPHADEIEAIEPEADFGDGALVLQLKARDGKAYERVMRELGPRLLATAVRMLGNEDDAREAVQDAFLSAFRNMQNFDGKSKLSTWLHRIVINACLMKLRTKRRKPSVSIETLLPRYNDEGHMELPIQSWRRGETGNDDDAPDDSLRQRVREEIETLPEVYRAVLMLRDVEDLDTAETAVVLGVSESAVKTRLHRARQALRAKLDLVVRGERSQEGGK
jgi:RNA polymerase sigma-70 factor (ECF subfamily)